jgi:chloramphenicol-sensitive protein RarD
VTSTTKWGYVYGLIAYVSWGFVPLYFAAIKSVPAYEILAHRIVWSVVLLSVVTFIIGNGKAFLAAAANRQVIATMLLSGSLLAVNWYLYIYATLEKRVGEAALGYYMMPLVNAFLATIFLKEKLRPAHYPALMLVALGVAIPSLAEGTFTWLAVTLPLTFGCYGLVRKVAAVDSFNGLCLETLLLAVPSTVFLLLKGEDGQFGTSPRITTLLISGGVVTVVPLLTYTLCIRRLPLLTLSFMQFLSPTCQMIVSYSVLGEEYTRARWAAVGCVWLAVMIFLADAVVNVRAKRKRDLKTPAMAD